MYLLTIAVGSTSKRIPVFLRDAASPNGGGLTGLAFNSAGLTWTVYREDDGNAGGTAVTLATATLGTWATGGFVEKDATNLPGWYELGLPNTALASGATWLRMQLRGAAGMVVTDFVVALVVSGTTYNESIALGVLAHVGPTCAAAVLGATTLGALAGTTPAAVVAAPGSLTLGVGAGTVPVGAEMKLETITLGVGAHVALAAQAAEAMGIALHTALHVQMTDQETFGQVRRGKTAVVVTAPSAKVKVR